jgi:hypothetical protein
MVMQISLDTKYTKYTIAHCKYCIIFQYIERQNFKRSVNSNAIHHFQHTTDYLYNCGLCLGEFGVCNF